MLQYGRYIRIYKIYSMNHFERGATVPLEYACTLYLHRYYSTLQTIVRTPTSIRHVKGQQEGKYANTGSTLPNIATLEYLNWGLLL
jgi:hypothetical protein